jgi:hypothetical protein
LASSDFAARVGFRCACFWPEPCRTDLSEVALSDFDATAVSPSAAFAGNAPATPIKSPAAKTNAALALIVM